MKKLLLLAILAASHLSAHAQPELWGMTMEGGKNDIGVIFKTKLDGNAQQVIHSFSFIDGENPYGSLMQASNGKLYGMTYFGGVYEVGVLFQYDLKTQTFNKKLDFNGPNGKKPRYTRLIEVCPAKLTQMEKTICEGDSIIIGDDYQKEEGTYYDTLSTSYGCDSIIATKLNVLKNYHFQETENICQGDTILWHNLNLSESGTYRDSLNTAEGCDSIYELTLNVHPNYQLTETMTISPGDTIEWRGIEYTSPGVYYDSLKSTYGCDSIYELNLTLSSEYQHTLEAEICRGDTFHWHGNDYTTSGVYYDTVKASMDCRRLFLLRKIFNRIHQLSRNASKNPIEYHSWRNRLDSIAGLYYNFAQSMLDSNTYSQYNLQWNILNSAFNRNHKPDNFNNWRGRYTATARMYANSLKKIIKIYRDKACDNKYPGNQFGFDNTEMNNGRRFNGRWSYSRSIRFLDSLRKSIFQDSIYRLVLTVHPDYHLTDSMVICKGDSINWRGKELSATGTYFDSLTTIHGCDSIYELDVTVHNSYHFHEKERICKGDTLLWRGMNYSGEGTYFDSLKTVSGCDSVHILNLTMDSLPHPDLGADTAIYGDEILWLNPGEFRSYLWQDTSTHRRFEVNGNHYDPGEHSFHVTVRNDNLCISSDTVHVSIKRTTGFQTVEESGEILIYPNPAHNKLNIQLEQMKGEQVSILIFSATGSMIFYNKTRIIPDVHIREIDISSYRSGVYLVKIISDNTLKNKRLIID